VKLVAVAKTFGPEVVREAAACGLTVFGENKVQEARAKIPECPGNLSWHLVGHLQSNKAGLAAELFDMIHSVDSVKLLRVLDRAAEESGRTIPVCLEVNVAGETSKFGVPPAGVPELLEAAVACPRITVAGLMTLPPFAPDPEKTRGYFRALRELKERCGAEHHFPLEELSMGMSHDFEVAIEEGATMIRVGTALFGERHT
jgi:hypothetical protein